jgi:hypothetical protein
MMHEQEHLKTLLKLSDKVKLRVKCEGEHQGMKEVRAQLYRVF